MNSAFNGHSSSNPEEEQQQRQGQQFIPTESNHSSNQSSNDHSRRSSQDPRTSNWNSSTSNNAVDALVERIRAQANAVAAAAAAPSRSSSTLINNNNDSSSSSPTTYTSLNTHQPQPQSAPASSLNFHQDFNNSSTPSSSNVGNGNVDNSNHSFAFPSTSMSDMLAPSPSFWSSDPRGVGGAGELSNTTSPSTSSSHFSEIQPRMVSSGEGEDAVLRIQGLHQQEVNTNNGHGHLRPEDLGGANVGDIVTPRPSHQPSVPLPLPQSLELMVENGDVGNQPSGSVMENQGQGQAFSNGMYRSSNEEEAEDSIMHSPPRAHDEHHNHQDQDTPFSNSDDYQNNQQQQHLSPTNQIHLSSYTFPPPNPNQNQNGGAPIETINQIGHLLDQVVNLANSAREHFKHGEHSSSSNALGDIQRSLAHIGQLGTQSLATVQQGGGGQSIQNVNPTSSSSPLQIQTQDLPPPPGHRRTDTASSLSSAVNSPLSRKGPMDERNDHTTPNSIPPSETQLHPSQSNSDLRSNALTPIQPPSAPPSAPPNMLAASSSMLGSNLIASSCSSPMHPRPAVFHTVSASTVPQLHTLPPNGFQQQLQQQQQSAGFTPAASGSQSVPGSYASSPTVEQNFMFPNPSIHDATQQRQNHRQLPQLATGTSQPSATSGAPNSAGGGSILQQHNPFAQSMPSSPVDRSNAASSSLRGHSRGSSLAGAVSPTQQLHQQQGNQLASMANEALSSTASNGVESLQMALQSEAQAREEFNKVQSNKQLRNQQSLDFNLGFGFDFSDYQNKVDGNGNVNSNSGSGIAASDDTSFSAPSSPRDDSYSAWSNTNSTDFDEMGGFESSHSSLFQFGGHVGTDMEDNEFGGQHQLPDLDSNQLNSSESTNGIPGDLSLAGTGSASSAAANTNTNNGSGSSSSGIGPRRSPRQTIRAQQTQGRKARSYSSPRNPFQPLSSHTIKGHRPQKSEAGSSSMTSSFQSQFSGDDHFSSRLQKDLGSDDGERTLRIKKPPPSTTTSNPPSRTRTINNRRRSRRNEESEDEDGAEDEEEEEENKESDNHQHELDEEGEGMGISIENLPSGVRKIPNVTSDIKALFDTAFHDFLVKICADRE